MSADPESDPESEPKSEPKSEPESAARLYVAQPDAPYQVRPPLIVDCSVLAAAVFDEANGEQALLSIAGSTLHAPWIIDLEMTNVALKKLKAGQTETVQRAFTQYLELDIDKHDVDARMVLALAQRYALSAYDAAYLLVASDLHAPLVTFDQKLGKAAQLHLSSRQ